MYTNRIILFEKKKYSNDNRSLKTSIYRSAQHLKEYLEYQIESNIVLSTYLL